MKRQQEQFYLSDFFDYSLFSLSFAFLSSKIYPLCGSLHKERKGEGIVIVFLYDCKAESGSKEYSVSFLSVIFLIVYLGAL